ncbi:GMP synthase-like glutamine amidotransferase [Herbaspirillum rubrisubalbicans]|nr:GMP synthase-like glutamine amidotransferase [Herbaspirillum rubrisubalbicans]
MRPIAIFQHEATQGPGVLLEHLQQHALPYHLYHPAAQDDVPRDASQFAGIVVLGSDHSVNDALPWIAAEKSLLEDALARDVPVLGHCFGAQLLARAMGAKVTRNICPNIGWGPGLDHATGATAHELAAPGVAVQLALRHLRDSHRGDTHDVWQPLPEQGFPARSPVGFPGAYGSD